jgi:hypothetical protein
VPSAHVRGTLLRVRRYGLVLLLTLPLTAAGTLLAHAAAYGLLGAPSEGVHGYLAHLPQVVILLSLPALLAIAVAGRSRAPSAWIFPTASLGTFVVQEHVERLAHTGELPFLLDRPVFWVGLALQLPFALAAWLVARGLVRVAAALAKPSRHPVADAVAVLAAPVPAGPRAAAARRAAPPRAPPAFLPAR